MTKTSLFTHDTERLNNAGFTLGAEIHKELSPIFKKWVDAGYSIRDISHVIHNEVTDMELSHVLDLPERVG